MSERDRIAAVDRPSTTASLTAELDGIGGICGAVVIVHSSLGALGWVAGGAQAVVEALSAAVGPAGTLVVPTQSGQLSDPAGWRDPPVPTEWFDALRHALPAFDPLLTTTRGMGAVAECLRSHPGAVRSAHPLLSFAALGPLAGHVVEPHAFTPGFGERSPLGRLYDLDAQVLLLGVDHASNTSLHLAEHRAEWVGKVEVATSAPMLVGGDRRWITEYDLDADDSDFARIGEAFAAAGGERTFDVGDATARACSVRAVVDFAVTWMSEHRPGSLDD